MFKSRKLVKFVALIACWVLIPASAFAHFTQVFTNQSSISTNATNLTKLEADIKAEHTTLETIDLLQTQLAVKATHISMSLVHLALVGTQPTGTNLHEDIAQIIAAINNGTAAGMRQASSKAKSEKFVRETKLEAIALNMDSPGNKEADCQAVVSSEAVSAADPAKNPTIKKALSSVQSLISTRSKTMRNQSADKELMVKEQAAKFCSQADFEGGTCKEEDVCQPDDPSCSAMSDRSASMFLSDGYKTVAEQEGAMRFIMSITDPFPKQVKRKSALTNEDLNNDSYKYKMLIEETKTSVPQALLVSLWLDRINIYEGDPDKPITKFLDNIDSNDTINTAAAAKHKSIVFSNGSFVSMASSLAKTNPNFEKAAAMSAAENASSLGAISRIEIKEMVLNAMYGNVAWEKQLAIGDGEYRRSIGRVVALDNRLKLDMLKKLDKLILAEAALLAKGAK